MISPLKTSTRISIIVHISELKLTSNTANLADLMLENAGVFVRGAMDYRFDASQVLTGIYTPLYLYPDENSIPLDEVLVENKGPYHLIVPDGNWHQAHKVKRREKLFGDIQSVHLPKNLTSLYTLRRPPFSGALCTYEAISHALGMIEGESITQKLLDVLSVMVERTKMARRGI